MASTIGGLVRQGNGSRSTFRLTRVEQGSSQGKTPLQRCQAIVSSSRWKTAMDSSLILKQVRQNGLKVINLLTAKKSLGFDSQPVAIGLANLFESNYVHVIGDDPANPVRLDLLDDLGRLIAMDQTLADLRNQKAGTFFLRVYRDPASLNVDAASFAIEINAPRLGQSHQDTDQDRLIGGAGDDWISGGDDLDVIVGSEGADDFVGAHALEVVDRQRFGSATEDTFLSQLEETLVGPTDGVVEHTELPNTLKASIAAALRHPVTMDADGNPVLHQPWFASELAQIESLDLSASGLTNLDGFEALSNLIHLRVLDLSNNLLNNLDFPSLLPRVETIVATGNIISTVGQSSLANTPNLKRLVLDENPIVDLAGLVGIDVVDDDDAGYVEVGVWQNEVRGGDSAWRDDYRFSIDGGSATWFVENTPSAATELFATWPVIDIENPAEVTYTISDSSGVLGVVSLLQTVAPGNGDPAAVFGGTAWQSLGVFNSADSFLTIALSGAAGTTVVADAVRSQMVVPPALSLETLSLVGSPLNGVTLDETIPRLLAANETLEVLFDPNATAPQIASIDSQTLSHRSLDFNNEIAVLPHTVLDGVESFMIQFWFQAETASSDAILSVAGSDGSNDLLLQLINSTTVRVFTKSQAGVDFTGSFNVLDGQWHHYALVRDTTSSTPLRVFVDGQLLSTTSPQPTDLSPLSVDPGGLVLGQEQDETGGDYSDSQAANGRLDEFVVWNRFWYTGDEAADLALQQRRVVGTKRFRYFDWQRGSSRLLQVRRSGRNADRRLGTRWL